MYHCVLSSSIATTYSSVMNPRSAVHTKYLITVGSNEVTSGELARIVMGLAAEAHN